MYLFVLHAGSSECGFQGNKYADIAGKIPCSEGYVRDKASDLWKVLSNLSGEEINKSNFCSVLKRLQFSVYSAVSNIANLGVTNNLSLCSDRLPSSENQTNDKKRNGSPNKKSEYRVRTLPNKNIREAPELGKIYSRVKEISTLESWILQENSRLIGILGISGIGKTTLSRHLLEKIQDNFDYVIWKNLYHAPSLSRLTAELVWLLSNQIYINFSLSETTEKNSLLDLELEILLSIFYEHLRNYRCLIILDNLQAILAENKLSGNYQNQFQNYSEFFQNIAELPHHSCLLFNSWESPL